MPNKRVCAVVVVERNGLILLGHHKKRQGWEPPGGKQEGYESTVDCAVRECLEETDVHCGGLKYIGHYETAKNLVMCYLGTYIKGKAEVMETHNHTAWKWWWPETLTDLTTEGYYVVGMYRRHYIQDLSNATNS